MVEMQQGNEVSEDMKNFMEEFKTFISRGNVMDMAVGIVVGAAFTAIVTSLVNDIIMPFIGIIIGGIDFSALSITVGTGEHAAVLAYGSFIQAIVNFLIVAFVIFCVVKGINNLRDNPLLQSKHGKKEEKKEPRLCPYCRQEIADDATRCPHCTSRIPSEFDVCDDI